MVSDLYKYVDVDDVYRTTGLNEEVVSRADVKKHIDRAESFVCRYTKNIYYKYNTYNVAVSSATSNTITIDDDDWNTDEWRNQYVKITSGAGKGQIRRITANTENTLTTDTNWGVEPDPTSSFSIFYVAKGFLPYEDLTDDDSIDGSGRDFMFLPKYPITYIQKLVIDDVEITPSGLYLYKEEGRIVLSSESELPIFKNNRLKQVEILYWYGVDVIPENIKRLVELRAGLGLLSQQMGGTFDVPSTFSLPDLNVSIGQAYVNIKGTYDALKTEYDQLLKEVIIYPFFG